MLLNREKIGLAYRVTFSEWKSLLPLLMLFVFVMMIGSFIVVTLALIALMVANPGIMNFFAQGAHDDPAAALAASGGAGGVAIACGVAIVCGFSVFTLYMSAVISLMRGRSHKLPLSFGYFTGAMARSFFPVMGVWWGMFWRAFLIAMAATAALMFVIALTHHGQLPSGSENSGAAAFVAIGMVVIWGGVVAYILPFNFVMYERVIHPQLQFSNALRRMRRQVRGRRWEILIALLVCWLPQIPYYILRSGVGEQHPFLFFVIGLPLLTFLSLPMLLINYLYYEEFEQQEGLAPMIETAGTTKA